MNRVITLMSAIACTLGLGCGASAGTGSPEPDCAGASDGHPTTLACTGLYADASATTLAAGVNEYDPSISLWADGAEKRRFIRLPAGSTIDTSDMDGWVFPTGTRLWKEFSLGGRRIETRYEEKRADGTWSRTTFAWSSDESSTTEVTNGMTNVGGTGYDIPAQSDCGLCHRGAKDGVLGFEAIGLSTPNASGMTMHELTEQNLLSAPPAAPLAIPGNPTEVAALGWLHANCGNACHSSREGAFARSTGLFMRLTTDKLGSVHDTDTYTTAVGVPSGFQPAAGANLDRIKPQDVAHSAIPYRALARDSATQAGVQMPPLGTHVPDMAGVALVDAWINAL